MKIFITGAGGQLAYDLIRVLSKEHQLFPFTKQQLDVTDAEKVQQSMQQIMPDVVIHTAAYTKVDQGESEPKKAYEVNVIGTRNIAVSSHDINAKLVYISSDFVFNGEKGIPYTESDPPDPLSVYGTTKYMGEQIIKAWCKRYYILRTAWLYGIHGRNFVKTILSKSLQQQAFQAAVDQMGSPTYCLDLACFIKELIHSDEFGTYHAANRGSCSKYEFMQAILALAGHKHIQVIPATVSQFNLKAQRPKNSALDDFVIRHKGFPRFRGWRNALEEFILQEWNNVEKGESS